jgi:hypothetical protein
MDGLFRGSLQVVSCLCLATALHLPAQEPIAGPVKSDSGKNGAELKFVVMVSRHGVRSPTGKIDQLNQYSVQPWPVWSVPPAILQRAVQSS